MFAPVDVSRLGLDRGGCGAGRVLLPLDALGKEGLEDWLLTALVSILVRAEFQQNFCPPPAPGLRRIAVAPINGVVWCPLGLLLRLLFFAAFASCAFALVFRESIITSFRALVSIYT